MRSVRLVRAFRRSPVEFLDELVAAGAARRPTRIGPERVFLLDRPGTVWQLLTTHARRTVKGRGLRRARLLLGDGLLTSEGETHQRHRRALQDAFRPQRMIDYRTAFTAAARRLGQGWTDQQPVDLTAAMSTMTLDAVGTALFGRELHGDGPRVASALADLFVGFRLAMAPGGSALLASPLPTARRVRRARRDLDAVVDELIAGHRDEAPTVIGLLSAAGIVEERAVRDEVLTILLAGHETTAMALTWAWAAIDEVPGLRGQLEAEWDAGGTALPLTTAVVSETLRLRPPSWLFSRRLIEPVELEERLLPAGTMCLISPALLHRDPRWWSDPEPFRPERWLRPTDATDATDATDGADGADAEQVRFDAKAPGQPRGAYLPFGAGPRMCVGEQFARVEAVTMLAELGRHWRVCIDGPLVPGPSSMTLRPRGPVGATVVRR